ncbi:uracil-DNA glycosylase family protein [Nitrosomonas sp.]|uniref:uracil-DNA glycosylase family protein n=1 Tax=Nitrosomonas sp. TaxID=42353 RepID=UPI0026382149|nr:uracil-DNA glycosylase family protein [Nitrosomonas sp.]
MTHQFDPGYVEEPFKSLCEDYPGPDVYPIGNFRVEWGPIFHRGRLDGSARVLLIGQDPAQNEAIVRRILVGEAGQRIQGFLAKLGIDRSYVMINTFLYSVYGSVSAKNKKAAGIIEYRHRWLKALLAGQKIEAVIALGMLADQAWKTWCATPDGQDVAVTYVPITHPTQPESAADGDKEKLRIATKTLLSKWNAALQTLHPAIQHPDRVQPLIPYGEAWQPGNKIPIPEIDFPPGLPAWMRESDNWARRAGADVNAKRRNITLTVPKGLVPKL